MQGYDLLYTAIDAALKAGYRSFGINQVISVVIVNSRVISAIMVTLELCLL